MRRILTTTLGLLMAVASVMADIKISGIVNSLGDGQPIIGASIMAQGTTLGTITDFDGKFSLNVPDNATAIIVSYVGMESKEVALVVGKSEYVIELQENQEQLDEIIVVAYGTTKKSSFTGSASTISADKLGKMQVSEVSKALEGAVSGVQISSSTGQPGSSGSIRVRGIGSLSASSSPLIVVDGVPYEGGLSTINPNDIESMNVLKDAAANSMYGARGANGVVMITTKRASAEKLKVTLENKTGFNTRAPGTTYNTLTSAKEYYELSWEAIRNEQQYLVGKNAYESAKYASENLVERLGGYNSYNVANDQLVGLNGLLNSNANLLYQDDWFDEAFGLGVRQENYLSIAGGTDKISTFFSLGFLNDDSYTVNSNLMRFSGRAKVDYKVTKWLTLGANINYTTLTSNVPNAGSSSDIFQFGQNIAPIYPIYRRNTDGTLVLDNNGHKQYDYGTTEGHNRPYASTTNPISQQLNDINSNKQSVVSAKLYARIDFLKYFNLTANLSVDESNRTSIAFQTPIGGDAMNVNGRSTKTANRAFNLNTNQLLNYSQTFGVHTVSGLLGHEIKMDEASYLGGTKENFFLPTNPELDNGALITYLSSTASSYFLQGVFGRGEYNYDNKYYVSASYRVDGSSKFHPDHRWGQFWSVGGSWRATQENFMADTRNWLNDLKIRASFGTQGNDNIPNYAPYKDQYVVSSIDGDLSITYSFRGNPNITWEKSNNFNAGIDFTLLNRVNGTIEFFNKETWDLLYAKPLPPSSGSPSSIWENTMRMANTGVEVEFNADIIRNKDWRWNVGFNMTHYKNKLKELPSDRSQDGWITGNYKRYVGVSIYNLYGYKFAGVDSNNGDALYYMDVLDATGNVIDVTTTNNYSSATRYEYGKTSIPDLYGGFDTSLSWKGFNLAVAFAYQLGGWTFDTAYQTLMHGGIAGTNWHTDIYNRWTPSNTQTDIPRLQASSNDTNASSDRFLVKASYISLRNVQFSYSLPRRVVENWSMASAKVFVAGDNLFLKSARKGLDPRQSFSGETSTSYSPMMSGTIGLQINF